MQEASSEPHVYDAACYNNGPYNLAVLSDDFHDLGYDWSACSSQVQHQGLNLARVPCEGNMGVCEATKLTLYSSY